jgi:hypothetical protein
MFLGFPSPETRSLKVPLLSGKLNATERGKLVRLR